MDPETAAYINSLIAIVWTLSALIVAMAAGWYFFPECDPECGHCKAKRRADGGRKFWGREWCEQHEKPKHECRDEHRP